MKEIQTYRLRSAPADPWRPDWREEGNYPHKLIPELWAWEFLRRSPVYQSAHANAVSEWKRRKDPKRDRESLMTLGLAVSTAEEDDAGPEEEEDNAGPEEKARLDAINWHMAHRETAREWGLVDLLDPASVPRPMEAPGMFCLDPKTLYVHNPGRLVSVFDLDGWKPTPEHKRAAQLTAAAILDFGQPLDWQLKKISADAEELQRRLIDENALAVPSRTKNERPQLKEALRLLDAWAEEEAQRPALRKARKWKRWQKVNRLEVAHTLWPDDRRDARALRDKVSGRLCDAKKLIQPSGYLQIIRRQQKRG